jgi:hypothetical protein
MPLMPNKQPLEWEEDYEIEKASFLIYNTGSGSRWLNDPKLKSFIRTVHDNALVQGYKDGHLTGTAEANFEMQNKEKEARESAIKETMEKVITTIENIDDSGGGSGRRIKAQLLNSLNQKN